MVCLAPLRNKETPCDLHYTRDSVKPVLSNTVGSVLSRHVVRKHPHLPSFKGYEEKTISQRKSVRNWTNGRPKPKPLKGAAILDSGDLPTSSADQLRKGGGLLGHRKFHPR